MAENKKRKPKKKRSQKTNIKKTTDIIQDTGTSVYKKYEAPREKSVFLRVFVVILAIVVLFGFVIAPLISL